jgi:hypothetical protein
MAMATSRSRPGNAADDEAESRCGSMKSEHLADQQRDAAARRQPIGRMRLSSSAVGIRQSQ